MSPLLWSSHRVPHGARPMCRIASDLGFIHHASQPSANCSSSFLAVPTAMGSRVTPNYVTELRFLIVRRFPRFPAGIDVGKLDHDETCHGCSCTNVFSDCQLLPSPTVSGLQVSNTSPLTSTTVVSCRSQPLAFAPCRPTLGSSGRFVEIPASSQFENFLNEHVDQSCTSPQVSPSTRLLLPRTFHNSAPPAASSHRVRTGRLSLRGLASSAVPRVLGGACTSPLLTGAPLLACTSPLLTSAPLLLFSPMTTSGPGATSPVRLLDSSRRSASNPLLASSRIALATRFLHSLL